MKKIIVFCAIALFVAIWGWLTPALGNGIIGRTSRHDWTEFESVLKEVKQEVQSALGLRCTGDGASAPGGDIYGWMLAFERYGIPNQEEARELLLKCREIAASVFDRHPAVLPQMADGYKENELFWFQIFCVNLDRSAPGVGDIAMISLSYGNVAIEIVGEEGGYKTASRESYPDFLARFPETKLKPYREIVETPGTHPATEDVEVSVHGDAASLVGAGA